MTTITMQNIRNIPYRVAAGPVLCLLLYSSGHAHGIAPLLASILFATLLYAAANTQGRHARPAFMLAGGMFLAMGFGLVPGFSPVHIGSALVNSGKALAGLSALAMLPSGWHWNRRCSAISVLCLVTVPALAWAIGYVHFAPAAWAVIAWFALANLFGTIAEEWFFRPWVQQPLQRFGVTTSLVLTALLFGLVHFGSGPLFMALAAVAGLAYAGVFQASGNSIWASVALHLALNITRTALFGL